MTVNTIAPLQSASSTAVMAADSCPVEFIRTKTPIAAPASAAPAVRLIPIDDITVPTDRLRALQPDKVDALAESIHHSGLLQPIGVQPYGGAEYRIVFGVHRLEAAKALKWESIAATVLNGVDADLIELAEIDENLIHAGLSPAEEAAHLAARKENYLRLYPETGHGGDRKSEKSKSKVETLIPPAFVNNTAAKTGKSRSSIAQKTARGEHIDDVGSLAGTSLDNGIELDALAKLTKEEQRELAKRAKAGERVSAKAPAKAIKPAASSSADPYAADVLKALPAAKHKQLIDNLKLTPADLPKKLVDTVVKRAGIYLSDAQLDGFVDTLKTGTRPTPSQRMN